MFSSRVPSARCGFSKTSATSAIPAGLRPPLPLKITSSIASPRRLLADCSPSTHLNASTTFDLPHPLGPTIPVIGESNTNSVRSANDLNPLRTSFLRRMRLRSSLTREKCEGRVRNQREVHRFYVAGHPPAAFILPQTFRVPITRGALRAVAPREG